MSWKHINFIKKNLIIWIRTEKKISPQNFEQKNKLIALSLGKKFKGNLILQKS